MIVKSATQPARNTTATNQAATNPTAPRPAAGKPAQGAPVAPTSRSPAGKPPAGPTWPRGLATPAATAPQFDALTSLLEAELSQPAASGAANGSGSFSASSPPPRRKARHFGGKIFAAAGAVAMVLVIFGVKVVLRLAAREAVKATANMVDADDLYAGSPSPARNQLVNSPNSAPPAAAPIQSTPTSVQPSQPPWPPGTYENKVNELIGILRDCANRLAAIHDHASAEANIPPVEAAALRIKAIAFELDVMENGGRRSAAEVNFAQQRLPEVNALVARIQAEVPRLQLLAVQLRMEERFSRIGQVGFAHQVHGPPHDWNPPSNASPTPNPAAQPQPGQQPVPGDRHRLPHGPMHGRHGRSQRP